MTKSYLIVMLPGDGIGPEIVDAALEVLKVVQDLSERLTLRYEFHQAGAGCYQKTGVPITPEALEVFQRAHATLSQMDSLYRAGCYRRSVFTFSVSCWLSLQRRRQPEQRPV